MRTRNLSFVLLAILLGGCVVGDSGYGYGGYGYDVDVAPPPPRVVVVPDSRPGYIWAPGYWGWNGRRHDWVDGRWLRERRGQHWQPDRWSQRGNRWRFDRGHWERDRR